MRLGILLAVVLLAVPLFAQKQNFGTTGGGSVTITTVSGLTSVSGAVNGTIAVVTDGTSSSDCATGGSSSLVAFCIYNGSTWSYNSPAGAVQLNATNTFGTSGTLDLSASTATNPFKLPLGSTSNPVIQGNGMASNTGCYFPSTSVFGCAFAGTPAWEVTSSKIQIANGNNYSWSGTTNATAATDTSLCRGSAGLVQFGSSTSCAALGVFKSAQTIQVTGADVTCGTSGTLTPCTSFTTITGLSIALPASSGTWSYNCTLIVGQATSAAADQIGVDASGVSYTNMAASGVAYTAAAVSTAAAITGVTAVSSYQSVITFTPGATSTKLPVNISGTIEVGGNSVTFTIGALTGAAADLLTIYRGSSCWFY